MKTVLLLGATGLVGRSLLHQLLRDPDVARVRVVARRPTGEQHDKLDEQILDLDAMEQHAGLFAVDQIFCALGTTIKVAGSQERFRVIDHDYPVTAARLGLTHGARHYLLVSALGANAKSRVFYNRVKGETENDIVALKYRSTTIVRPSLLLGPREEHRRGEELAKKFAWLTPAKYKPVQGENVARALVDAARVDAPGVRIIESRELPR